METSSVDPLNTVPPAVQPIGTAENNQTTQGSTETPNSTSASDEFGALMRKALGETKSEVSEEELFAAVIQQRLQKENAEAASFYESQVNTLKQSMARWDGKVSMEDVGKAALKATVAAGMIDGAKAEIINAQSFQAAQLDDNINALYDGYGGADDPTRAVASMEDAMAKIKLALDGIDSGKSEIAGMSLDVASNTVHGSLGYESSGILGLGGPLPTGPQSLDGADGFLWKPESEKNGKLVVILPEMFTGMVNNVEIHRALPATEETKVEEGQYSGVGNGGREHFRFSQSGGSYGDNLYLVSQNADGTTSSWEIRDGGARND